MSEPVTTDLIVLKGWPKAKRGLSTSAEVAAALKLTVFQVTARLKGMEGRGLLARDQGKWFVTEAGAAERENPSPSISGAAKKMRVRDSTGAHSGAPDDTSVLRVLLSKSDWVPSLASVENAKLRLPDLQQQLSEYKDGTRENMAIRTEIAHCAAAIKVPRKGKWTSRVEHGKAGALTVYVSSDGREYVPAQVYETADLLVESKIVGIPPARLRLYSTSAAAKAAKKANNAQAEQTDREAAKAQDARNARILAEESNVRDDGKPGKRGNPARQHERKESANSGRGKRVIPKADGHAARKSGKEIKPRTKPPARKRRA